MLKARICRILCALAFLLASGALLAQQGGHSKDFRGHQDYDGPILNQRKTTFFGNEATNMDGRDRYLVKQFEMKNYREDGSLVMTAQAPECIYDIKIKEASSTGALQMRTGDGRFFIEGVGFFWNEAGSKLTLSNNVHSILHSETTTNGQATNETVIFSKGFDYELKTGLATYQNNVRVNDPKMKLTCELLIANLASSSTFSPGDIVDVPLLRASLSAPADSDKVSHYLAGKLSSGTRELLFTLGASNSQVQKSLAEDLNSIIQSGPLYDPERFAGVKLSPETSELVAKSPSGADLVRLNHLLLQDAYPKAISRNGVPQASGRPDSIIASNHVVIDYSENGELTELTHATADKAVYTRKMAGGVTNQVIELSGSPKMERTNGWMTADVIIVDQTADMIHGIGSYHSVYKKPADPKKTNAPAGDTEIFCDKFDYNTKTKVAIYRGNVRVVDPQMKLWSTILQASVPEKGGSPNHIVAETNVVIDFVENGQLTHAMGERAIYDRMETLTATNQLVQLVGNPKLERPDGWMMADSIVMDSSANAIHGVGNVHTIIKKRNAPGQPEGAATADTEIFSDRFDYDTKSRIAIYLGRVRVIDPELKLTSAIVTAWLPEKGGKPDRIVARTNVVIDFYGSPLFTSGDFVNLPMLTSKLKQPPDGVSQFLANQISPTTRELLPKYRGGTNLVLQQTLALDFNRLIQSGSIYDQQRFAGVKLQPATSNLLAEAPQGLEQVWLNRRLLLDAYPQELAKNNFMESGEKTHATGQQAVYTYAVTGSKTNQVLELTGNPMLGRPSGWTTADKIILDQASGRIRSIHNSFSKTIPAELNKTNNTTRTNAPNAFRQAAN